MTNASESPYSSYRFEHIPPAGWSPLCGVPVQSMRQLHQTRAIPPGFCKGITIRGKCATFADDPVTVSGRAVKRNQQEMQIYRQMIHDDHFRRGGHPPVRAVLSRSSSWYPNHPVPALNDLTPSFAQSFSSSFTSTEVRLGCSPNEFLQK